MDSVSSRLSCFPALGFHPLSSKARIKFPKKGSCSKIFASRREAQDQNYMYNGRLVDESMIVLRKRIHEMKMVERNYEPPEDWTEWEKRYYTSYDALICNLMGFLQSCLMETRPTVALFMFAIVTLSLPTSIAVAFFHMMDITKEILAGIQHLL